MILFLWKYFRINFFDRVKFVLVFVMFGVWFLLVLALSFRCVVFVDSFLSMLLFINTKKDGGQGELGLAD